MTLVAIFVGALLLAAINHACDAFPRRFVLLHACLTGLVIGSIAAIAAVTA